MHIMMKNIEIHRINSLLQHNSWVGICSQPNTISCLLNIIIWICTSFLSIFVYVCMYIYIYIYINIYTSIMQLRKTQANTACYSKEKRIHIISNGRNTQTPNIFRNFKLERNPNPQTIKDSDWNFHTWERSKERESSPPLGRRRGGRR